jgi:DNA-directed RNA polymerase subunit beta'
MSIKGTLGSALINAQLPEEYRIEGTVSKGVLKKAVVDYARNSPQAYATSISKIKDIGDHFATYEGISVGLDDIAPQYAERDKVVKAVSKQLRASKDDTEYTKHLMSAQTKFMDITKRHPGDMGLMASSGGRGSAAQLMKTTTGQALVGDLSGKPIPYFIQRSYAEGLSPAEAWLAGDESRGQVIKGQLGTADPGELGKLMATMMSGEIVSQPDCGTTNGIMLEADDPSIPGRYLAGSNRLVDTREMRAIIKAKRRVKVRSPMTCEAPQGVCQKCQGTDVRGSDFSIGDNVGIIAATVMAEPLTQMALSSKHGVSLVEDADDDTPVGVAAVRQFLEIPSSFAGKAVLSQLKGRVDSVQAASQGGHNIYVGNAKHYAPPNRKVVVKEGSRVDAGDLLTSGMPAPNEVVGYKGLGAGRKYIVESFKKIYEGNKNIDSRHFEVMAKAHLNSVEVGSPVGDYLPGDIIPYNIAKAAYAASSTMVPLKSAEDRVLADSVLHYTAGTRVTKAVAMDLGRSGVTSVAVTDSPPQLTAVMKSASRVPLLNPNWMERMSHRYQKANLVDAAQFGESSDLHGNTPYTAIVFGKELKKGPGGEY